MVSHATPSTPRLGTQRSSTMLCPVIDPDFTTHLPVTGHGEPPLAMATMAYQNYQPAQSQQQQQQQQQQVHLI